MSHASCESNAGLDIKEQKRLSAKTKSEYNTFMLFSA